MTDERLRAILARNILTLPCRVGLHSWRDVQSGPAPVPTHVVVVLGCRSFRECVRCGLVRIEGRWAGFLTARAETGLYWHAPGMAKVRMAEMRRELDETAALWAEKRREWGLKA